eukprot:3698029-Rhodomonas_salina.2
MTLMRAGSLLEWHGCGSSIECEQAALAALQRAIKLNDFRPTTTADATQPTSIWALSKASGSLDPVCAALRAFALSPKARNLHSRSHTGVAATFGAARGPGGSAFPSPYTRAMICPVLTLCRTRYRPMRVLCDVPYRLCVGRYRRTRVLCDVRC